MKINVVILIILILALPLLSQSLKLEAEDMTVIEGSNLRVFDTYVAIYGDSSGMQFQNRFNTGIYEVSAKAREMAAGAEHALISLANNKDAKTVFEVKSLTDSTYIDTIIIDDGDTWKLLFINDLWIPDAMDRNVYIDYINFVYIAPFVPPVKQDTIKISWDANSESDLKDYAVYYGTTSRLYSWYIQGITDTSMTVADNFILDIPYYFAVTATDTANNESGYSDEVSYIFTSVVEDTTAPGIPFLQVVPIFE